MGEEKRGTRRAGVHIRLPDSVCDALGIEESDAVEISVEGDAAVLKKVGKYTRPVVKVHNRCSAVNG